MLYTIYSREKSEQFFKNYISLKGKNNKSIIDFIKKEINVDVYVENNREERARIDKLKKNIYNYSKKDESERNERLNVWNKGWLENYSKFKESLKYSDLVPGYVRDPVMRIHKRFVVVDGHLAIEHIFANRLMQFLFYKYFSNVEGVLELGCGTAKNLIILRKIFPNHALFGVDWSKHSLDIIHLMNKQKNENINGIQLNMLTLEGIEKLPALKNKAILSVGSFEQLGSKWKPIFDLLLAKNPEIVVNIEPIEEFYHEDSLFDESALLYHRKRKYLKGFFSALQHYEKKNIINIVYHKRLFFGSDRHEGYSVVVWKNIT